MGINIVTAGYVYAVHRFDDKIKGHGNYLAENPEVHNLNIK